MPNIKSSYFNKLENHATDVPVDNKRFIREEIRKDSNGEVIEIRRYFLDMDDVEVYWQKLFLRGDPATAVAEDVTKRVTIEPWEGPLT